MTKTSDLSSSDKIFMKFSIFSWENIDVETKTLVHCYIQETSAKNDRTKNNQYLVKI